jgi:sugar/nucleoside kinase (ribokinase family)
VADTVLVVGDLVTDVVAVHTGPIAVGSDTDVRVTTTGGGSAANTAAWLAHLGTPAELVAVVGADPAGAERVAELIAAGVGCHSVRRDPSVATGTVIVLAHAAERTMLADRGANAALAAADVEAALARADPAHVHVSGYPLLDPASRPAARRALARTGRWTVSLDAASAAPLRRVGGAAFLDWVRGVDLLVANVDETRALLDTGGDPADLARALAGAVGGRVVVKLGPAGAVWAGPDGEQAVAPAEPATAVDPTGAGDAFAAGLLTAWLAGAGPAGCLRAATRAGAAAVAQIGARPRTVPA